MRIEKDMKYQDWGQQVIEKWLDSRKLISPTVLQNKHWMALPVPDILNPMEAEWLADTIQIRCAGEVLGIAFEYESKPDIETIKVTQNSLLAYNGSNSWRAVILTSTDEEFLYYKDEANRYYVLCGDEKFITNAYRCSLKTAKQMYFDEWVNLEYHSEEERRFLTEVWNQYE